MQDIVLRESKVAQSVSSRRNKGPQDIALVQTSDCEVNETWNAYEPNFAPWEFLSNQTTLASVVPDADEPDSSSWESLSSLSNPSTPTSVVLDLFSCPGSTEVPHQSTSYTRILKRIPCWFGSQFDYYNCPVCEDYATALLLYPDSMPLESRCSHCSALLFHYTMTFLPLVKVGNHENQKQRYVLPEDVSEKVSKKVFNDDVVGNFAQIFVEGPGNQILVRSFGV